MTCRNLAWRARCVTVALGLLVTVAAASANDAVPADDPIQTPLWRNAAQAPLVADTLPAGNGKYQLLSLPLSTESGSVASIVEDDLGGYNKAVWRLGHWVPDRTGTDKYVEPPALSTIERGLGYWLITADPTKRVDFDRPAASADTIELPLIQGPLGEAEWNQLGNPFPFNSAVASWRVVKRDSLLTLGQAASRNWIDTNMRTWDPDNSQYSAAGTINRHAGFWARLTDRDTSLQWTRWLPHDTTGFVPGFWSSVRIDSKGSHHISFYFDDQLRYVTRKGSAWARQVVDVAGNLGGNSTAVFSNVELDSLDQPYIAFMVWQPWKPYFTRRQSNGQWTVPEWIEPQTETISNGWGIKLKLFHGAPRVAYCDLGAAGAPLIKYAEKTVSGWNVVTVSGLGSVPDQVLHDLGFDISRTGVPHIATVSRNSPYGLRYFTRTGATWTTERVDTLPAGSTGLAPSLVVDANGIPHISYFDEHNVDLKYARKTGSSWSVETVDATGNTGNFSEIMIQPNGQPAIAFLEYSSQGVPSRIRYARRSAQGTWQIETVDDAGVFDGQAYLGATLDKDGNPTITYQGSTPRLQLRLAEKIRGRWRVKIPPVPALEPAKARAEVKPVGSAWAIAITARQGERAAEMMYLGVADEEARMALRSSKAPAPPGGDLLSLHVRRGGEDFVRDFQPPAETVTWEISTEGGEGPGEQTLDFQGLDLPFGLRLYLRDPESGITREVRSGDRVTLAARPRTLGLVATTAAGGLPAVSGREGLSFAYPNPFGARTGFAFTLTRESDIHIDVFDVSGRRVRSLARSGAVAGEHVLVWDGRDASGRLLPSGIYLARWQAGSASGSRRLVKIE